VHASLVHNVPSKLLFDMSAGQACNYNVGVHHISFMSLFYPMLQLHTVDPTSTEAMKSVACLYLKIRITCNGRDVLYQRTARTEPPPHTHTQRTHAHSLSGMSAGTLMRTHTVVCTVEWSVPPPPQACRFSLIHILIINLNQNSSACGPCAVECCVSVLSHNLDL
jgi:hypothetical protein